METEMDTEMENGRWGEMEMETEMEEMEKWKWTIDHKARRDKKKKSLN